MAKRQILYGIAVLALIAANILTQGYSVFISLLILIIAPCLSVVYAAAVRQELSLKTVNVADTFIRGEKLKINIEVANNSYLVVSDFYVVVEYRYNNTGKKYENIHKISVGSQDKTELCDEVRLINVGELTVDCEKSYIYDPLRLFRFKIRKNDENRKILVMPVLNEPDYYALYNPLDDVSDATEYSKKKKGEDSSEIFDVRNYIQGDALNRVHWKLSAKEEELLVKEFSLPISSSNCILVELHRPENEDARFNLNGIFELVYAIGNLACVKEKKFKLAFYSVQSENLQVFDVLSYEELVEIIRNLIKEKAYEGNLALENYLVSDISDVEKLFYITDKIDEGVYELEDNLQVSAYIYAVNGSKDAGQITTLFRSTLYNVDRDDIRWGLSNTVL